MRFFTHEPSSVLVIFLFFLRFKGQFRFATLFVAVPENFVQFAKLIYDLLQVNPLLFKL